MGKKPREIKFAVHMPDDDKEKDAFYENLVKATLSTVKIIRNQQRAEHSLENA